MKYFFVPATLFLSIVLHAQNDYYDYNETKDLIRAEVSVYSVPFAHGKGTKVSKIEFGKQDQVTLHYEPYKKPVSFRLHELYKETDTSTGIQLYQDNRFIQFHLSEDRTRVISFESHEKAREVYDAFLQLMRLSYGDANRGVYFIRRDTRLSEAQELLVSCIRPVDKKDEGDSTIKIRSRGEGWLDKDSMPVGYWSFYATDSKGKEYLFKEGTYTRTDRNMFTVMGMDTDDVKQRFYISMDGLKSDRVSYVPFIKTSDWVYYHDNGRKWKDVFYKWDLIPIELAESIDLNTNKSLLSVRMPEPIDEYIIGEVIEFDKLGHSIKQLFYDELGFLMTKTLYAADGRITKKETATPQGPVLLPNNN